MTFIPIVLSVIYLKVGSLNCFLTYIFICVDLHWIALFYSEEFPRDSGSTFELRIHILCVHWATPHPKQIFQPIVVSLYPLMLTCEYNLTTLSADVYNVYYCDTYELPCSTLRGQLEKSDDVLGNLG